MKRPASLLILLLPLLSGLALAGERNVAQTGLRVYDSELGAGRIVQVMKGGTQVKVDFDGMGSAKVRDFQNLGVRIDCSAQNICEGTRVLDPDYDMGRVVEVFSNGRAIVTFDQHDGVRQRELSLLSKVSVLADVNGVVNPAESREQDRKIANTAGSNKPDALHSGEATASIPRSERAL